MIIRITWICILSKKQILTVAIMSEQMQLLINCRDHFPFFEKNCKHLKYRKGRDGIADITPFIDWSDSELERLGSLEVYYSREAEHNDPIDVFQNSTQIDMVKRIFLDLDNYNSPSEDCPTSWATATIEVAEAALKNRVKLSAKQLLECLPKKEELNGCKGVRPKMILNYLMEVGLVEEKKYVDCDSLEGLKHYYFYGEQPVVPNTSGLMRLLADKKNPVFVMVAVNLLKLRFVKDMSNMKRGMKCGGYEPALYGVVTGYHYDESNIDDSWWELRSHMIPGDEMILRMPISMNMENANYAGIAAYAVSLTELSYASEEPTGDPSTSDIPTPQPTCDVRIVVIRATQSYSFEEAFKLYKGNGTAGTLMFTQPTVDDEEVYNWSVFLCPGIYTLEMTDSYGDGWDSGSRVTFSWDNTRFATASLYDGEHGLYTLIIPDSPPTPQYIDPLSVEISVIRTTIKSANEESFKLYEGTVDVGVLEFSQPTLEDDRVYNWTLHLRPGVYTVEMIDYVGGWSDGSKVEFVFGNVTLACVALTGYSNGLYILTVPESIPTQPSVDSSAVEITIIRTTNVDSYPESFKLYEGESTSGDALFSQSYPLEFLSYYWTVHLRPGVYTLEMTGNSNGDGWSGGSRIAFSWNNVIFASTSLFDNNQYSGTYSFTVPDSPPTQSVIDPLSVEVSVIRTTTDDVNEEYFDIREETSGSLVFIQKSLYDLSVYYWTLHLRPGVYTVEMFDYGDNTWSDDSRINFVLNGVVLGSTSLLDSINSTYNLTIPNTLPIPSPTDSSVSEISIVRTTRSYAYPESFRILEGEDGSGNLVFVQPPVDSYQVYTWNVTLRPGVYRVEMTHLQYDCWRDDSRIDFVKNSIVFASTSLTYSYYGVFILTIPDSSLIDPLAMEISVIRRNVYWADVESFKI